MREIKFRAWVKSENRMITDTQEFIPLIVTNKGVMKLQPQYEESYYEILPNDWFEFMESTGLHDKNGKEVYESDIVYARCNGLSAYGVVVWVNGGFAIEDKKRNRTYSLFNSVWQIRVDGNIYENPDLLKS